MEYYSAIIKNEIMPFAATGMDLEIVVLSEVSQKKKNMYKVVWYSHLLKNFPQFVVIHTVKGSGVVNKVQVSRCFSGTFLLFQ